MPISNAVVSEFPATESARNGSGPSGGIRIVSRVIDWVTTDRMELINITDRVNEIVKKSGIRDGIVHLQSLHTTASVFLNEWQDALLHDVRRYLEGLVEAHDWRHNDPRYSDCERKNADSHMRGMLMGQTLSLQVRNSAVLLGTWQNIILAEFDGPRSRSMSVQVTGI
jgi:secondary thiamine-phosphate synthase enzyme